MAYDIESPVFVSLESDPESHAQGIGWNILFQNAYDSAQNAMSLAQQHGMTVLTYRFGRLNHIGAPRRGVLDYICRRCHGQPGIRESLEDYADRVAQRCRVFRSKKGAPTYLYMGEDISLCVTEIKPQENKTEPKKIDFSINHRPLLSVCSDELTAEVQVTNQTVDLKLESWVFGFPFGFGRFMGAKELVETPYVIDIPEPRSLGIVQVHGQLA